MRKRDFCATVALVGLLLIPASETAATASDQLVILGTDANLDTGRLTIHGENFLITGSEPVVVFIGPS